MDELRLTTSPKVDTLRLKAFARWLEKRGRSAGTVENYVSHVKQSEGTTTRVLDTNLAPKTRGVAQAALKAWAKFTKDSELMEALEDVIIPPQKRISPKFPFSEQEWITLRAELQKEKDALGRVLQIVAIRGLRIGDVLRLRRKEVEEAVQTGYLAFEAKGGARLEFTARPFTSALRGLLDAFEASAVNTQVWQLISTSQANAAYNARTRLRSLGRRLDISPCNPHRFRRTVATLFLNRVGDINKLRLYMGWSNIGTAAQYVDARRRGEFDAIERELLGED